MTMMPLFSLLLFGFYFTRSWSRSPSSIRMLLPYTKLFNTLDHNIVRCHEARFQLFMVGNQDYSTDSIDSEVERLFSTNTMCSQREVDAFFLSKPTLTVHNLGNILNNAVSRQKDRTMIQVLKSSHLQHITDELKILRHGSRRPGAFEIAAMVYCLQATREDDAITTGFMAVVADIMQSNFVQNELKLTHKHMSKIFGGLRRMTSDSPDVLKLLDALASKLKYCGAFDAQAVGNVCYGLQRMNSEYPEVRQIVEVLVDKVKSCKEPLKAQAVGNALY